MADLKKNTQVFEKSHLGNGESGQILFWEIIDANFERNY